MSTRKKPRRGLVEWLYDNSPLGRMTKDLEDLSKVLDQECDEGTRKSAERSYRIVMSSVLSALGFRTELLLFLLGSLLGSMLVLLFR